MACKYLSSLPALLGFGTAWAAAPAVQKVVHAAASRGLATARAEEEVVAVRTEGLPPPWEPPPHNPRSLKPKPAPTLQETLAVIRQAPSVVEVHNAHRRKNGRLLPPPIAAAMFSRVAELKKNAPHKPALPSTPTPAAGPAAAADAASGSGGGRARALHPRNRLRGLGPLVEEISRSWDTFLHLTTARDLAALIRASGETGLLLESQPLQQQQQQAEAAAAGANASGSKSKSVGGAAVVAGRGSLVQRSLDVLLDCEGRELAEAGPQAVLDVSYGLMLAGHDDAATWRTLGPVLRSVHQTQLQAAGGAAGGAAGLAASGADSGTTTPQRPVGDRSAGGPPPGQLAGRVLQWLQEKGLPV